MSTRNERARRLSSRPTIPVPRVGLSEEDARELSVSELELAASAIERVVRRGHGDASLRREAVSLRLRATAMRRGAAA